MSLKLDRMLDDLQRTISTTSVSTGGGAISSRRVFSENRSSSQQNGVNHHHHHQQHPPEHPATAIRGRSHSGHRSIQRTNSEVGSISLPCCFSLFSLRTRACCFSFVSCSFVVANAIVKQVLIWIYIKTCQLGHSKWILHLRIRKN